MTENKRFVYYEHKGADYILDNPNTELDFIEMLGDCLEAEEIVDLLNKLNDENEQLKSELSRYKEVNRLDIWKSSYNSEDALITELQNKCDKKQEHIVLLENKIHRMREDIKRLEALYHYRGYIGSGDVKKEYYRMEKLLRAENDQLKDENKQLKSQLNEMIQLFDDSGLDYHIGDELEEILND